MAGQELTLPRVARGDRGAMEQCLDRYGNLVRSLALRMTSDSADADDAVQETFIDVWKHAGRFDPSLASEATFISTIAKRRIIDQRRRRSREPRLEPFEAALDVASSRCGRDPAQADEVRQVVRAMNGLPESRRRILALSFFGGWSQARIASLLGLPMGTVKSHVRRGVHRLREMVPQAI